MPAKAAVALRGLLVFSKSPQGHVVLAVTPAIPHSDPCRTVALLSLPTRKTLPCERPLSVPNPQVSNPSPARPHCRRPTACAGNIKLLAKLYMRLFQQRDWFRRRNQAAILNVIGGDGEGGGGRSRRMSARRLGACLLCAGSRRAQRTCRCVEHPRCPRTLHPCTAPTMTSASLPLAPHRVQARGPPLCVMYVWLKVAVSAAMMAVLRWGPSEPRCPACRAG